METIEEILKKTVFGDMPHSACSHIAHAARTARFSPQECIIREGDCADTFYMLIEGSVSLQMQVSQYQNAIIRTLRDMGDIFGCSSLFEPKRYGATVVCLEQTCVMAFAAEELTKRFLTNPLTGYLFMKKTAEVIDQRLIQIRNRLIEGIS